MVNKINRDKNDIFAIPILKTIFKNRVFIKVIQILVLSLFVYAIYFGFINPSKENIFTKSIFWGFFWSFFMVLTLITFGRIFCGICPHGFLGKYITKIGLKKEMPNFLKNRYIGISILVIGWWGVYYTFPGALKIPFATAIMFLVLTILAFIMYFLYKDMSYCKYICPIGTLTKAYQKVSFTKLGTYKSACANCRTFECNTACSYNLKPFTFDKKNSMDDCTLCMDCTDACEAVSYKLITPASTLFKKTKVDKADVWVYILVSGSITLTMGFHHFLARSNISDDLPWKITADYVSSIFNISGVDLVGFFAFFYAIVTASVISIVGMYLASKVLNEKFSTVFSSLGYAYIPLFIITGLAHLLQGFFTKTYANIGNGFIQGFSLNIEKVENLASRNDEWLNIFNIFPYVSILLGFFILYKRVNLFKVSKVKKVFSFIFASSLILFFLWFNLYKIYVVNEYGMKKRDNNHSNHGAKKVKQVEHKHNHSSINIREKNRKVG